MNSQRPRRNKYGANAVYVDRTSGAVVPRSHPNAKKIADSEKEHKHWLLLLQLSKLGIISGLERQKPFKLHAVDEMGRRTLICRYVADFVYLQDGARRVVDVKGFRTAIYNLKKKWMAGEHGITIEEV